MSMYGSGTRIAETMAIRVKDLNLVNRELTVRVGKGTKDRVLPIAKGAVAEIRRQIEAVARLHTRDLETGTGWARLPGSPSAKGPRGGLESRVAVPPPQPKADDGPENRPERQTRRPPHDDSTRDQDRSG